MLKNNDSFTTQYRIYYEDTDSGGVVYYANYLKFFERARTDFLRSLSIHQAEVVKKNQILFVVKRCEIEYISPAKLDDLIEVYTKITSVNFASIDMFQEIKIDNRKISELNVKIVCVDSVSFRPKKIPSNISS